VAEQQLDLYRLRALTREWEQCPPVQTLVAAYLGYTPPSTTGAADPEQMQSLMSAMPTRQNAPKLDETAWLSAIAALPKESPAP
jgi:hypothetical protein